MSDVAKRWLAEIKAYEETCAQKWLESCKKITEIYRNDTNKKGFNVLWSNVETTLPLMYSQTPVPSVTRRVKGKSADSRVACIILERALEFELDVADFDSVVESVVKERLLYGRGVPWVRYVADIAEFDDDVTLGADEEPESDDTGLVVDPETSERTVKRKVRRKVGERIEFDIVPHDCFGHIEAPRWSKVSAVWKKEVLTRRQIEARFGARVANDVTYKTRKGVDEEESGKETFERADIYEVWDKEERRVLWVSPDYKGKGTIDEMDDPLHLRRFFPCPMPLYGTLTSNTLIPVPDYDQYRDQASEINRITGRISQIIESIKVRGVYDASIPALKDLLTSGMENDMLAVEQWSTFSQAGGLKGAVDFIPVRDLVETLVRLYERREALKQEIFEITGISDIVRGASDPNETASAQRIKGSYAANRIGKHQRSVQTVVRDMIEIAGEIIAEHYSPTTLWEVSGFADDMPTELEGENMEVVFQSALELLQNDRLRTVRVDIETDSTISPDKAAEGEQRAAFLQMASGFIEKAAAVAQQQPLLAPLFGKMLLFGARGFPQSRELEAELEAAIDTMLQQQPQQQETDGAGAAEMAKVQMQQAKAQMDAQIAEAKLQLDRQKAMADSMLREREIGVKEQAVKIDELKAVISGIGQAQEAERADMQAVIEMLTRLSGQIQAEGQPIEGVGDED